MKTGHLLVYAGLFWLSGVVKLPLVAGISLVLALLLIWASAWDFSRFEIPDLASLLLVATGLAATWFLAPGNLLSHAAGAALWGGLFWVVSEGYFRLRGRDGLGLGDAKLMAGIGAWLGILAPISVVLMAALGGIGFVLVTGAFNGGSATERPIAFGPFLCISAWGVWLFGPMGLG